MRKKIVEKNEKKYVYWEGRVTVGYDPGTGKQIQRSVTGKTQKEVHQRMRELTVDLTHGTYTPRPKLTTSEWLEIWSREYLRGVKPLTRKSYEDLIRIHIDPSLGAIKLDDLQPHMIQSFYNGMQDDAGLSPKTIKNVHGVLHRALGQAVDLQYIRSNPCAPCTLPRRVKPEIHPLTETEVRDFLRALDGEEYARIYKLALFTGLREGELMGLTWGDIAAGRITVRRQLQQQSPGSRYYFAPTKNGKMRVIAPAPAVLTLLQEQRAAQAADRLRAGPYWIAGGEVYTDHTCTQMCSECDLIFRRPDGRHVARQTLIRHFKRLVEQIGRPDARVHDLRHTYAVSAIRAGDDIKSISSTLGHATTAFTLDVYAEYTLDMQRASAERMGEYLATVYGINP